MHKIFGAVLVVVGAFLFIKGHDMSRTFVSQARDLIGSPSNKVMYYYLGGAICCAVGLVEFFRPDKK